MSRAPPPGGAAGRRGGGLEASGGGGAGGFLVVHGKAQGGAAAEPAPLARCGLPVLIVLALLGLAVTFADGYFTRGFAYDSGEEAALHTSEAQAQEAAERSRAAAAARAVAAPAGGGQPPAGAAGAAGRRPPPGTPGRPLPRAAQAAPPRAPPAAGAPPAGAPPAGVAAPAEAEGPAAGAAEEGPAATRAAAAAKGPDKGAASGAAVGAAAGAPPEDAPAAEPLLSEAQRRALEAGGSKGEELRQKCRAARLGVDGLGCNNCCNDGRGSVPCIDVQECAARAPSGGRFALAYAQVGRPGWPWLTNVASLSDAAKKLAERANATVDLVLIIPSDDAMQMNSNHKNYLAKWNVVVKKVQWSLPPSLKWYPSYWRPGQTSGWCGPQDLVKLNALGLDEYRAVAVYDQDIEIQGDVSPALLCAATGRFLSASGGAGEPMNVGFFAVRPHARLLRAAAEFWAENLTFDWKGGWDHIGFAPVDNKFVGAECGQGYFHTFFYKQHAASVRRALERAGLAPWGPGPPTPDGMVEASQVDRCIWNYQHGVDCPPMFNCKRVVAHHKPNQKPEGADCGKRSWMVPAAEAPPPTPSPRDPAPEQACEMRTVTIGQSCNCSSPTSFRKEVAAPGFVRACQPTARNPSGDSFCVSSAGATVTALRADANSCWCDDRLSVQCCIVLAP